MIPAVANTPLSLFKTEKMQVRCLISESEIESAVADMGRKISNDYKGKPLTILGVLTGSIVLIADLMRQITQPHKLGLLQASSYRAAATTAGRLILDLESLPSLDGRDVLVVDDIFDTGRTMQQVVARIQDAQARSVRSAVLLWKRSRTEVELVPDYHAFEIPDRFVVGYGLDYNDEYRHLPFIGVLEPGKDGVD
jgi:hypoxanthine phosphoribosyltransferase